MSLPAAKDCYEYEVLDVTITDRAEDTINKDLMRFASPIFPPNAR